MEQRESSDEDDDGPSARQCAARCARFSAITDTDTALAQYFLQDHKWDVELSVSAYFNAQEDMGSGRDTNRSAAVLSRESRPIDIEAVPDALTCSTRCSQFAAFTGTSSEIAMTYLTKSNWNLDESVEDYFQQLNSQSRPSGSGLTASTPSSRDRQESAEPAQKRHCSESSDAVTGLNSGAGQSSSSVTNGGSGDGPLTNGHSSSDTRNGDLAMSRSFKLISWNIDGLDQTSTTLRARAVVSEIISEQPDVVYLQEVVEDNLSVLREGLRQTYEFRTDEEAIGYFTAVLLRKATIRVESSSVVNFAHTKMGRNLRCVLANWHGVPLTLMTSHLESGKEGTTERVPQFRMCLDYMINQPAERVVVFGGDLNVREPEVNKMGIPQTVKDLWIECGSRPEARFTFDCANNTNASQLFPAMRSPVRTRYDRLYFRPSSDSSASHRLIPSTFGLIGLAKPPNSQRNISDHWGIMAQFKLE